MHSDFLFFLSLFYSHCLRWVDRADKEGRRQQIIFNSPLIRAVIVSILSKVMTISTTTRVNSITISGNIIENVCIVV